MATKSKKEGVSNITDSSLTYTLQNWEGVLETKKVQWKPESLVGKLKTAAARTIAKKLSWYCPTVYNDVTGFRKSDKTVSRRIKWDNCIKRPLTKAEIAKFTAEVKKLLKANGFTSVYISNAWKWKSESYMASGTICVYMRESVC